MEPITFSVREVRQSSSAADYVVRFRAELSLLSDSQDVEITCVSRWPEYADSEYEQIALRAFEMESFEC